MTSICLHMFNREDLDSLARMARCTRDLYHIATPLLYHTIILTSKRDNTAIKTKHPEWEYIGNPDHRGGYAARLKRLIGEKSQRGDGPNDFSPSHPCPAVFKIANLQYTQKVVIRTPIKPDVMKAFDLFLRGMNTAQKSNRGRLTDISEMHHVFAGMANLLPRDCGDAEISWDKAQEIMAYIHRKAKRGFKPHTVYSMRNKRLRIELPVHPLIKSKPDKTTESSDPSPFSVSITDIVGGYHLPLPMGDPNTLAFLPQDFRYEFSCSRRKWRDRERKRGLSREASPDKQAYRDQCVSGRGGTKSTTS